MSQAYLDLSQLHQLLLVHFKFPELQQLCIDLALDPHQLAGERTTSNRLSRALVLTCHRSGILEQLLERCMQLRPQSYWPQGEAPAVFSTLFIPDYADVLPRVIAFLIDVVIVSILAVIVNIVFYMLVISINSPSMINTLLKSPSLTDATTQLIALFNRLNGHPDSSVALLMNGLNGALLVLIAWLYFAGAESSTTQATTGKQWLGIKVANSRGQRISLGRATLRFAIKLLSLTLLGLPLLLAFGSDQHQSLHDRISRTFVVKRG